MHGGFEGTDLRFSYYFPPEEQYAGRFFQPILAVSGTENAFGSPMLQGMGGSIAFAIDSGAYMVESNLGSLTPYPGEDGTVTGYRASAAAAEYSRIVAAEMYGEHRPYGYCYGGSGGGYKTMSCMENTDVWDGGVPFIIGSPMSCRTCSRCKHTPCAFSGRSSLRSSTPSTPVAAATCTRD